ncbi:MAG: fibronectin type III domain-containing protein [Methylococcaceae bacterium]
MKLFKVTILFLVMLVSVCAEGDVKPVLANISVKSTAMKVVNLTTNVPSIVAIKYGTNYNSLSSVSGDAVIGTIHHVTLANLTAGTRYFYKIIVTDKAGNIDRSKKESFVTN